MAVLQTCISESCDFSLFLFLSLADVCAAIWIGEIKTATAVTS